MSNIEVIFDHYQQIIIIQVDLKEIWKDILKKYKNKSGIDIQNAYFNHTYGIVFNPAAYTHTSVAILDALKSVNIPTVEVHISDISKREDFRQKSYIRDYVKCTICGKGLEGYNLAIDALIEG